MEILRVLELYSGIGGMHYALKQSGISGQVVAAIDINTTANQVYRHNFPGTPLWNRTIEGILLDEFKNLQFDMILMSPPCQPFTRLGRQRGIADPRTKSFLYILNLLPRLSPLPRFILLENVKGFESSSVRCVAAWTSSQGGGREIHRIRPGVRQSHDRAPSTVPGQPPGRAPALDFHPRRQYFVQILMECGYIFQEVMVSPTSVGIPNSRLRYFLMAKISTESISSKSKRLAAAFFCVFACGKTLASGRKLSSPGEAPPPPESTATGEQPLASACQNAHMDLQMSLLPAETESSVEPSLSSPQKPVTSSLEKEEEMEDRVLYKLETTNDAQRKLNQNRNLSIRQIQDFLEPQENDDMDQYLVPSDVLLRYALILDIVKPICRRSICFTKGYGRYVEGTGSVLQCDLETEIECVFKNLDQFSEEEKLQQLQGLKLRYFTPREVANIMGFPKSFWFLLRHDPVGNAVLGEMSPLRLPTKVSGRAEMYVPLFSNRDAQGNGMRTCLSMLRGTKFVSR
ncbi:tRNA (cytosine(38)-C(5))-methyltransferase-like isoform X3 [Syngnathus typhle]|uniref:tRNA (cytosine(38)-C(5))-methyltransferase-like isoform X3 n=1 Tax=Syngnathus typhle TaxID=161592 RepID=UPI002A6AD5F0|nr:tRNA (cytosine(38)-C(5))-methyltransferase-like isoform X3 [Syngnathus typhle]